MLDIYTKQPITTRSQEHILLNALGGKVASRDLLDKTTNDVLGRTIDVALTEALHLPRTLLGALSADGQPPPPVRGMRTSDGESYNLLPDGFPELSKPSMRISEIEDMVTLEISARSMKEAKKLAARTLEKHGQSMQTLEKAVFQTPETLVPTVRRQVSFGPACWRAIAKHACNLLAFRARDLFSGRNSIRSASSF